MSPRAIRGLRKSTTARFVLLHLTLSLACMLPILFFVYIQIDRILLNDFARPLEYRKGNLQRHYERGGLPDLTRAVISRARRGDQDETAILLVGPDGRKIAGNVAAWPAALAAPGDWTPVSLRRDGKAQDEGFLAFATQLPSGHRLLLGGLLDGRSDMQVALLLALAAAFALAFPIGLLGSIIIVREMHRMVDAIARVGQHIAAGDLSRRAESDGSGDPLDRLGTSLNAMLARIETLVEEHRLVTDALAHDLRSPLTRIVARIDRALRAAPGTDQRDHFEAVAHEVDSLLHMLDGTLEISRAEAGIGRNDFTHFDLAAMLRDLCEMYQPLAAESHVTIVTEGDRALDLHGNRGLVARALANLIDNAIKYGAAGGCIRIGATRGRDAIHLFVADRGIGIPADRRDEALRKYRRLDGARASPGSGLGLALVNAVASLHEGMLMLEDNEPGLRATLHLSQ
ncbi:HAMP domain-containing sensor histidine kinase [Sphingobium aquiterrae]|uniref:sensor histidine kinase n=1 Tax=Sphingobium aquiterrae TaxID=2038656 RepID=UPI00301ACFC4